MEINQQCYNCGKFLSVNEMTREHVPPKNLFDGYPESYKKNRITVTSCFDCNNRYSFNDEQFRNLIGAISEMKVLQEISNKTVRAIFRKSDPLKQFWMDEFGMAKGVRFKKADIAKFHEKIFKGIFFHEYGKILPEDFKILVDMNSKPLKPSIKLLRYLQANFKWKYSGHADIFKYIIQPFQVGVKSGGQDIEPLADDGRFIAVLVYNGSHAVIVSSFKKELKN